MVGNGVTDDEFDGNALIPFVHGMGLISDDLFQVCLWYAIGILKAVNFFYAVLKKYKIFH